jgi:hypothetical protein
VPRELRARVAQDDVERLGVEPSARFLGGHRSSFA